LNNKEFFNKTARFWTTEYARGAAVLDVAFEALTKRMTDIGYTREEAVTALSIKDWDIKAAMKHIS